MKKSRQRIHHVPACSTPSGTRPCSTQPIARWLLCDVILAPRSPLALQSRYAGSGLLDSTLIIESDSCRKAPVTQRIAPLPITAYTTTTAAGAGKRALLAAMRGGRSALRANDF